MAERYQVIIVGGGPVGAALGVELGMRGVSCAVVERYPEPQRIPKGQNLSQRTLEHFYFWGIVNELRAARVMPNNYPIGGVTAYKHLMSDYWYTPPGREAVQSFYYEENERLPQYRTEAVLRAKLATLTNVTTFFGWNVERVEQDEHGRACPLPDPRLLVGCQQSITVHLVWILHFDQIGPVPSAHE